MAKNLMSNKAWVDNYGQELSKIILLTTPIANDTVILHHDASGISRETIVKVAPHEAEPSASRYAEHCLAAVSVRHRSDTTHTLHYCTYGKFYESSK